MRARAILEYILSKKIDWTIKEVEVNTGLSRKTIDHYVFILKKEGFIKETRRVGNARLYKYQGLL